MRNRLSLRKLASAPSGIRDALALWVNEAGEVRTVDEDGTDAPLGNGGSQTLTSPLEIDDCALWLDASQLALADNAAVTTWPDLSPSGFDATQATADNKPVCKTAIYNGLRVVRFDPSVTPRYLGLSGAGLSLFRDLDGFTIAILAKLRGGAGEDWIFEVSTDADASSQLIAYEQRNMVLPGGDSFAGSLTNLVLQAGVFSCDAVAGAGCFDASPPGNPARGVTSSPGTLPDAPALAILIGTDLSITGTPCDIGEIIVYQRAITRAEREQLLAYLAAKWATL